MKPSDRIREIHSKKWSPYGIVVFSPSAELEAVIKYLDEQAANLESNHDK